MKYIKLFLASFVVEFEQERNELGSYIRMLNDIYAKRGIYFELTIWDDLLDAVAKDRKQKECNQEIRDSQYFYVLFGKDAGEDTIEEFNVALEQFRKSDAPASTPTSASSPRGSLLPKASRILWSGWTKKSATITVCFPIWMR